MAEKVSVFFAVPAGGMDAHLIETARQGIAAQTYPQSLIEVVEIHYAASAPGGCASALNAAREVATGAYVVHAEPGVLWDRYKVERQVAHLQARPDGIGCVHGMTRRDVRGKSVPLCFDILRRYGIRIGSLLAPPWGPGAAMLVKEVSDRLGAYRGVGEVLWEYALRMIDREGVPDLIDDDLAQWRVGHVRRNQGGLVSSDIRHRFLKSYLDRLDIARLFQGVGLVSEVHAHMIRAALYVQNDDLKAAHAICQPMGRDLPEASYWHGVIHRREPDFDNAHSWFLRAESPGMAAALYKAVCDLLQQAIQLPDYGDARACALAFFRHLQNLGTWDALYYLDLCRQCANKGDEALHLLLEDVQRVEFETAFEWTFQKAVGA